VSIVYLIGFQGVGIRPQYQQEHGLILLGHVGIAFAGNLQQILGFHPTVEALSQFDPPQSILQALRNRTVVDGCLQDDTAIFQRAYELSQHEPRLTVWQMPISLEAKQFEQVQLQAHLWYEQKTIFPYGLPATQQTWDNCATFPRHLNLPLPETTGHLYLYIAALKARGIAWQPAEE
jgi:hypothetical protein